MNRPLAITFLLTGALCSVPLLAEPPACGADVDACVRTLVLENAGFIAACSATYPALKPLYDRAFSHWAVLKMPVPGLAPVVREGSSARINASFEATEILRNLSEDERQKECSTRLANLTTHTPTLAGRALTLPPDALKKYAQ